MKLTATQQRIYDEVVKRVNGARECKNYDEYWDKHYAYAIQARWKADYEKFYLRALDGIVSVKQAKHESLKKLETLGLVRIIDIELNLVQLI